MNRIKKLGSIALLALAAAVPMSANAAIEFSTDFESATAITDDGWNAYINGFSKDCTTWLGWGYPYPIPNSQVAALAPGASSQVLNVYTNYDDGANQAANCLETNVYVQFAVSADDVGTYVLRYDVEFPPPQFTGTKVNGFAKVLSNDFSATYVEQLEPSTDEGTQSIIFDVTDDMVGGWLQIGFNNYATDWEPSGMYYDNVSLELIPEGRDPVESIPALDHLGKLALLVLLGVMGVMVMNRRGL